MTEPREPRLEGERKPKRAKTMVKPTIKNNWAPFPRKTLRKRELFGVRKTSP